MLGGAEGLSLVELDDGEYDSRPPTSELRQAPVVDVDSPLPTQVERLEWLLSEALLQYRANVEKALFGHLENLESIEAKHQLECNKLRAENNMLRGSLNVEPPEMFQNICFSDAKAGNKSRKYGRGSIVQGDAAPPSAKVMKTQSNKNRDTSIRNPLGMNLVNGKKGPPPNGGSWQQFIAWVPSGAALAAPEPWKPLPPLPPTGQPQAPQTRHGPPGSFNGIVPGAANQDSNEDSEAEEAQGPAGDAKKKPKFNVLEVWHASRGELATLKRHSLKKVEDLREALAKGKAMTPVHSVQSDDEEEGVFSAEPDKPFCILHPHSRIRTAWDIFSLLLVLYDMVAIPLNAYALPQSLFLTVMDWTTRLFWTIDVWFSLTTGVVMRDGTVNFNFKYIAKKYLSTWAFLDAFIVSTDWSEVIFQSAAGGAKSLGRLTRIFRIVRMFRLLRLVRMQEMMSSKSLLSAFTSQMQSDVMVMTMSIIRLSMTLFAMAHFMSCFWWAIGEHEAETRESWTSVVGYNKEDLGSQYLISLRWALSQFSGGMEEVKPITALERVVAVCVWICSFMTAAVIWSILTSSLTQLHIIGGSQSRQLSTLRKYLKQNFITSNLALRMQRSAQHAISGDLTQDAIELLPVVSEPLRVEMHFEMYSPVMKAHPFFNDYISDGPQVMRRVCHYGMSTFLLSSGDVVFTRGESPSEPKMYFVPKGSLEYNSRGEVTTLDKNMWIAEAVLWTQWTYKGTLTANNDVKLAVLHAKTFQDIVDRFKETVGMDPKVYAAEFVDHLNAVEKVTDLTMPGEKT